MKALLSAVLAIAMCFSFVSVPVSAANVSEVPLRSALDWSAADKFGAYDSYVGKPKTGYAPGHYIIDNGDGTVSGLLAPAVAQRYNTDVSVFYVERYDASGNVAASKVLPMELPIFGAFLAGQKYNYIAFGQNNREHDDNREVWRIVQYDKNWNRIAAISVNGGDTYTEIPFCAAVANMAESDDGQSLTLYAARNRYDGHQSNITFYFAAEPFRLVTLAGEEFPVNHVSHSFGQFVRYDGDQVVTVDHGDAYPRSFVLQAGGLTIDLWNIYGEIGANVTNAIGSGFEVSGSGYLFLGCSDAQTGVKTPWNVFLTYVSKDSVTTRPKSMTFDSVTVTTEEPKGAYWRLNRSGTTYYVTGLPLNETGRSEVSKYVDKFIAATSPSPAVTWLTDSQTDIKCARLVRINDNAFVAMWSESDGLHWQQLDGQGQRQGEEQVLTGVPMPPTQSIVRNGSICWIQIKNKKPYIFTLSTDIAPAQEDVPSAWAADTVDRAIARGIVPQYLQGQYRTPITRAEFCALATQLYESVCGTITQRKSFYDTSDINIQKMAALGVVNGVGNNMFSPDQELTREQAATMLARLADALDVSLTASAATFSDNGLIHSWAFAAVGKMQASGIMNGVGNNNFSPLTNYTRQESIITMIRMLALVK